MQPIAIKCPDCAARLAADADADTVRCEYCGTVSYVRKRSRVFQIPDTSKAPPPQMPVATQVVSQKWVWGLVASGAIVTGVGAVFAIAMQRSATSHSPSTQAPAQATQQPAADAEPPPPPPPVHWWAKRPVLLDVDDDGGVDIVGHCWTDGADDYVMCSVDGDTGELLWKTDAIAARTEIHKPGPTLNVAGSVLVSALGRDLRGFGLDGKRLWETQLGEVIEQVCRGADGSVRIELADKTAVDVGLGDGKSAPAKAGTPCEPLESDSTYESTASRRLYDWTKIGDRDKRLGKAQPGMYSEVSVHRPSTNTTIAVGTKRPGTQIPMIASYQVTGKTAKKVLWSGQIPDGDGFDAYEQSPKASDVEISDDAVFVTYAEKEEWRNYRMTAFDVASGARRFEIRLPGSGIVWGIAATADRAYVSRMYTLRSYDARTGELLWTYPKGK